MNLTITGIFITINPSYFNVIMLSFSDYINSNTGG